MLDTRSIFFSFLINNPVVLSFVCHKLGLRTYIIVHTNFAIQSSHFLDIAGWLAKMAYIDHEHCIQWRNAHGPYSCRKIFDSHHREVVEEIECRLSPGKSCFCEFELTVGWNVNY